MKRIIDIKNNPTTINIVSDAQTMPATAMPFRLLLTPRIPKMRPSIPGIIPMKKRAVKEPETPLAATMAIAAIPQTIAAIASLPRDALLLSTGWYGCDEKAIVVWWGDRG